MLRLENIKIREELESEDVAFRACKKSGIDFKDVINYYIYNIITEYYKTKKIENQVKHQEQIQCRMYI